MQLVLRSEDPIALSEAAQQAGHYKNCLADLVKSIDLKQVSKANYLYAKLYCLFN